MIAGVGVSRRFTNAACVACCLYEVTTWNATERLEARAPMPAWVKGERKPRPEPALDKCEHCGKKFTL